MIIGNRIKLCEPCAYSESGRVVFAYLCGYHCSEVQLMRNPYEDGYFSYALIDYGKDSRIALNFIGEKGGSGHFPSLPLAKRLESIEVGQRLARLFIGGSVAAAVYRNKGDVHIPFPMQMDHEDMEKAEHIFSILKEMTVNNDVDFLENEIANALYTLNNSYVWKSIEQLAELLLEEEYLDRNDIEESLERTGLLPFYA